MLTGLILKIPHKTLPNNGKTLKSPGGVKHGLEVQAGQAHGATVHGQAHGQAHGQVHGQVHGAIQPLENSESEE